MFRISEKFSQTIPVESVEDEIQEVLKAIMKHLVPVEVYLFGSAATGEFYEHSDFDFLVVVSETSAAQRSWKTFPKIRPSSTRSLDLIVVCAQEFKRKRDLGGVCYVASTEGRKLFPKVE